MKTKVDPIRLTMDMVAIPSYSYMDHQEEAISRYILDFFLAHGLTAYRTEIVPGRDNCCAGTCCGGCCHCRLLDYGERAS